MSSDTDYTKCKKLMEQFEIVYTKYLEDLDHYESFLQQYHNDLQEGKIPTDRKPPDEPLLQFPSITCFPCREEFQALQFSQNYHTLSNLKSCITGLRAKSHQDTTAADNSRALIIVSHPITNQPTIVSQSRQHDFWQTVPPQFWQGPKDLDSLKGKFPIEVDDPKQILQLMPPVPEGTSQPPPPPPPEIEGDSKRSGSTKSNCSDKIAGAPAPPPPPTPEVVKTTKPDCQTSPQTASKRKSKRSFDDVDDVNDVRWSRSRDDSSKEKNVSMSKTILLILLALVLFGFSIYLAYSILKTSPYDLNCTKIEMHRSSTSDRYRDHDPS
jgi:hypothetical protein